MDNEITEYRVRTLKFDDNYYDKPRAVKEKSHELKRKSSAQGKNSVKGNDKQTETSRSCRVVAAQTSNRTERKRSPYNQGDEKTVKQVQVHRNSPIEQNKPRSTVHQFPTKRKKFISVGARDCRGLEPTNK